MARRVITEREVRRASGEGQSVINVWGAMVTPGARALAAQLGVRLDDTPPDASPAAPTAPPRTTRSSAPVELPLAPYPVALAADVSAVELREAIALRLQELSAFVTEVGGNALLDPSDLGIAVAQEVAAGRAQFGIVVDRTGIGSCMAANKIRGVRAAACRDVTSAAYAREHHDANVLALGGGFIGPQLGVAILDIFLTTPFAGGAYATSVAKIDALEHGG